MDYIFTKGLSLNFYHIRNKLTESLATVKLSRKKHAAGKIKNHFKAQHVRKSNRIFLKHKLANVRSRLYKLKREHFKKTLTGEFLCNINLSSIFSVMKILLSNLFAKHFEKAREYFVLCFKDWAASRKRKVSHLDSETLDDDT